MFFITISPFNSRRNFDSFNCVIVCGKSVVHRSASMSEHESCKETKSVKSELRIVQRKYDSVLKKLKKMEQERTEKKISLDEREDCDYNDSIVQEKERECELIKQKYEDAVKEVIYHLDNCCVEMFLLDNSYSFAFCSLLV